VTVERTQVGHETRYTLREGDLLSCVLTYGEFENVPPSWKILLPGPTGTEDLHGTRRFPEPDASLLRGWLAAIVGAERADALAEAVDAEPPRTSGWRRQNADDG
jgi:hypothetical protein